MPKLPQIEPFLGRVPQPKPRDIQPGDRTLKRTANGGVVHKQPNLTPEQSKALDRLAGLTTPSSE